MKEKLTVNFNPSRKWLWNIINYALYNTSDFYCLLKRDYISPNSTLMQVTFMFKILNYYNTMLHNGLLLYKKNVKIDELNMQPIHWVKYKSYKFYRNVDTSLHLIWRLPTYRHF